MVFFLEVRFLFKLQMKNFNLSLFFLISNSINLRCEIFILFNRITIYNDNDLFFLIVVIKATDNFSISLPAKAKLSTIHEDLLFVEKHRSNFNIGLKSKCFYSTFTGFGFHPSKYSSLFHKLGLRYFNRGMNYSGFSSNKPVYNLYFEIENFNDFTIFLVQFKNKHLPFGNYTVYIKVIYNSNKIFMAGNQFEFKYHDHSVLNDLYKKILHRLGQHFSFYNLSDSGISYIQVSFYSLYWNIEYELFLNKDKIASLSLNDKKCILDVINISVSTEKNYLPKPLEVVLDDNLKVKNVKIKKLP
uniref:Uncharacterized protein n=1 Tax=Hirsutella vermicola TaxID=369263 RepID=A0A1S6KM20_9HYPO|nr:hypothetical protein [Hirsutella vermicola]AQT19632.1 hypothetical protein [Hirsutella vermicola]